MKTIEHEFIEFLGTMAKSFGLDDLAIKVFAVLYVEPEDIAMDQIADKTGYSLASICNTMKMLETMRSIKRIKKPGSKKVFFYMDKDLVKWNIMKLEFAQRSMVRPAKEKLPRMLKKYKKKAKTENDKKRMDIIRNYYNQMILFEGLLNKWIVDLKEISRK